MSLPIFFLFLRKSIFEGKNIGCWVSWKTLPFNFLIQLKQTLLINQSFLKNLSQKDYQTKKTMKSISYGKSKFNLWSFKINSIIKIEIQD